MHCKIITEKKLVFDIKASRYILFLFFYTDSNYSFTPPSPQKRIQENQTNKITTPTTYLSVYSVW